MYILKEIIEHIVGWLWGLSILWGFASSIYTIALIFDENPHSESFEGYLFIAFIICSLIAFIIYKYMDKHEKENEELNKNITNFLCSLYKWNTNNYSKCQIIKNIDIGFLDRIEIHLKDNAILSTSLENISKVFEYGHINEEDLLKFDSKILENYTPNESFLTISLENDKFILLDIK